jgi:hypothetical protein
VLDEDKPEVFQGNESSDSDSSDDSSSDDDGGDTFDDMEID